MVMEALPLLGGGRSALENVILRPAPGGCNVVESRGERT
jgi:hypothetical protein